MLDSAILKLVKGKRILITGATGSIGSELVRQLIPYRPSHLLIYSRDEHKQQIMARDLDLPSCMRFLIGDVRDSERIRKAMENVNIVFHAAALKHVPACEYNPFEAVKTNVLGTQNVLEAALYWNVDRFVTISTDKASAPASVMGATKLLSEKIVTSAIYHQGKRPTISAAVRFGNVLASRGSVLEIFQEQIQKGTPVTITDRNMTRFIMTIPQAAKLVLKAVTIMQGSEVFILKMKSVRIADLARGVAEVYAPRIGQNPKTIRFEFTGGRPGEKMHELLMTREEARFALEREDMFILRPFLQFPEISSLPNRKYAGTAAAKAKDYCSEDQRRVSRKEIQEMLKSALLRST